MIDQTVLLVCLGTGTLGIMAGIVGCWLFLEKKSLFGDTISHATFPGITGVYLLTFIKHPLFLLLGGLCSALLASFFIQSIKKHTTLKQDSILGVILAGSFGIGTVFLSKIQLIAHANQAGISKYLLGNPATMLREDIIIIIAVSIITLAITARHIAAYRILLFDPIYAQSVGINAQKLPLIMLAATTLTIIFGLQAVGIILMSALLINPAAAAYQWTKNFTKMMFLAAIFGATATIAGTIISCMQSDIPTGPIIVIIATTITAISVLLGPWGIITTWYKNRSTVDDLNRATMLSRFLLFNEAKQDPFHAHNVAALDAIGKSIPSKSLILLEAEGLIESPRPNFWRLTKSGIAFLHQKSGAK